MVSSSQEGDLHSTISPYEVLFNAVLRIPISHILVGFMVVAVVYLYNFLECHFIRDFLSVFRGQTVRLTFNPESKIYEGVVSKCKVLHGRYLATPWLASPHLQTSFLSFSGRSAPVFTYRRQIFHASDGGTIALDWLLSSDVSGEAGGTLYVDKAIPKDNRTPIVVVIPGLTSDSNSVYLKHLVYHSAKGGHNVVVCNHRGLGGVSITSEFFYNAGWTEDLREVIDHVHGEYPNAPLFITGTSMGANVMVKYLGEEGENTPVAGAIAVCCPWDLLIDDRFMNRRLLQRLYYRALAMGLQDYALLHEQRPSCPANWEGIKKARTIREFDRHGTCLVGKYETPDTYYRRASCSNYVSNVAVPLLCISALDDPVCTQEAIPWDECWLNKNVVLATTLHGGHLAHFEGITASSLWWVRAVTEFLCVLHSSPYMHRKKDNFSLHLPSKPCTHLSSSEDVMKEGMISAVYNETRTTDIVEESSELQKLNNELDQHPKESEPNYLSSVSNTSQILLESSRIVASLVKRQINELSQLPVKSIGLFASMTILTSWPLVGFALYFFLKKKITNLSSGLPM